MIFSHSFLSTLRKKVRRKSSMNWDPIKENEFESVLNRFSAFIRAHIVKFNLQKYGLDPDDIVQEVRIKIWKLLHNEKYISNYPSYIKKIVDSSVIDQFRKLKREEGIFLQEKMKKISEKQNVFLADNSQDGYLKEIVGQTVERLRESRRQVVKLYLMNLSIEEISIIQNWTKDKTRNLLYRGLSDLKVYLKNKDIENGNQDK
jgi:RNA polymerase sigma-70 factor (ECF subfamily)